MPAVQVATAEFLGKDPIVTEPDVAILRGCATWAAELSEAATGNIAMTPKPKAARPKTPPAPVPQVPELPTPAAVEAKAPLPMPAHAPSADDETVIEPPGDAEDFHDESTVVADSISDSEYLPSGEYSVVPDEEETIETSDLLPLPSSVPFSVGAQAEDGEIVRLFERDAILPAYAKKVFLTSRDDQSEMVLTLYQGRAERDELTEVLGQLRYRGINPAPAGERQIAFAFRLDEGGMLNVAAEVEGKVFRKSIPLLEGVLG